MTRSAFEQQAVATHDAIPPFCIDARSAQRVPASPQQRPCSLIAVCGQVGNQFLQFGDERHVIQNGRLAPVDPFSGALQFDREIRARHTQDFTDRLQRSSPGSNGERAIN
ncbi:hypothetical protein WK94_14390 [Burkholderia ubonensis]|nr:hypothetical protein WK94_14390 [Burkholderia ubonensis]